MMFVPSWGEGDGFVLKRHALERNMGAVGRGYDRFETEGGKQVFPPL